MLINTENPYTILVAKEHRHILSSVLDKLPVRHKEALILRYVDKLTYEQCGKIMNVTRERVRQIVIRATRKLEQPFMRKKLESLLQQKGGKLWI